MDVPTIGRIVIYRHREGYDSPALVTATATSIAAARAASIDERLIRSLSSPQNVHLAVFTPSTVAQGQGGTTTVIDASPAEDTTAPAIGTWRWPERSA